MKASQIKPLRDRVLVKCDGTENQIGRILIPEAHQKKIQMGTVLAVGPKVNVGEIKRGDRVAFAAYGGKKIETEDMGQVELFDNELVWVNLNQK